MHRGQVHRPLIEALPGVKSGLVKYKQVSDHFHTRRYIHAASQFHVSPETNAALAARGLPVMPHDGIAEWAAEKLEDILEVWASDEIVKVVFSFSLT